MWNKVKGLWAFLVGVWRNETIILKLWFFKQEVKMLADQIVALTAEVGKLTVSVDAAVAKMTAPQANDPALATAIDSIAAARAKLNAQTTPPTA